MKNTHKNKKLIVKVAALVLAIVALVALWSNTSNDDNEGFISDIGSGFFDITDELISSKKDEYHEDFIKKSEALFNLGYADIPDTPPEYPFTTTPTDQ